MKKINLLIFALIVLISVLALMIFLQRSPVPTEVVQNIPPAAVAEPEKQPIIHYPVPVTVEAEKPTEPDQNEVSQESATSTDEVPPEQPKIEVNQINFSAALSDLNLQDSLFGLLVVENFIPRLVTTIDSLPEKQLSRAHLPLLPPKGRFITAGTTESPQTSTRNHPRYDSYVKLLENLDPDLVMAAYIYFYPLFQTAYEQLGYPNAYFNDRLVFVIDHLLETPSPAEPILLAQPSVLYTYDNPALEKLSAGQKILLRIGPAHRQRVVQIFKDYRKRLVGQHP